MHGRCQRADLGLVTAALILTVAISLFPAPPAARAQTQDGFAQPVTLRVLNATSGRPGAVERLTIDYMTARPNTIADVRPSGSVFTLPSVPLRDGGEYIVTAWWQNVPYWYSFRGRQMAADTLTIHVFDTTGDLAAVRVTGMNIVVQRRGELLTLEYLLKLDNATSPQMTVLDSSGTLTLAVPADLDRPEATYRRGPQPTEIPVTSAGASLRLAVPLTWGQNTVHLTAAVPWHDGLELPVGLNVPVDQWSLLLSPDVMEATAPDLMPDASADFPGYARYRGPQLEADHPLTIRIAGGPQDAGAQGNLFSAGEDSTAAEDAAAAGQPASGGAGLPLRLILILALAALILLFVANRRTRS